MNETERCTCKWCINPNCPLHGVGTTCPDCQGSGRLERRKKPTRHRSVDFYDWDLGAFTGRRRRDRRCHTSVIACPTCHGTGKRERRRAGWPVRRSGVGRRADAFGDGRFSRRDPGRRRRDERTRGRRRGD